MGISVLVVDDDPVFRHLARRILEGAGLDVCGEAGSVEAARAVALALEPQAALVDVGLPDGDGAELAHELAAMPWGPRVLITSTDRDALGTARRGNAIPFVPKDDLPTAPLERLLAAD